MMLLANGLAWAKFIDGTDGDDTLKGTMYGDNIDAGAGDDVVRGKAGADFIKGGNGEDTLYGNRGGDRIVTAGRYADMVDCGQGKDRVTLDSKDQAINCEEVILEDDTSAPSMSEVPPDAD